MSRPEPGVEPQGLARSLLPAFRSLLRQALRVSGADALAPLSRMVKELVADLAAAGCDPLEVAGLSARLGDALVRRLVGLHLIEQGPPPAPFAWLSLGSAGRREQPLPGEQDHALVVGDQAQEGDLGWYRSLAARVEEGLAAAGHPPCPGGIAAGRLLRRRAEWCARVREAVAEPGPTGLLEVAVLLDGRRVAGRLGLAELRAALLAGAENPRFLRELARAALAFPVAAPRRPPAGRRALRFDLKRQALAPLVVLARCYGLAARCPEPGTSDRLEAARAAGLLGADVAGPARGALRLLLGLRLRQDLTRAPAAGALDLSSAEARAILPALRTIRRLQRRAANRFGLE